MNKTKSNSLAIFKERFFQALKENKEYKANLYSVFFLDLVLIFTYIVFFSIYSSVIGKEIGWTLYDFIVYNFALLFGSKFKWSFSLMFLRDHLLRGDLNTYLTKPINIFFFENMRMFNGVNLIMIPLSFIVLLIITLFGDYNLINIFLALILLIIGTLLEIIYVNFFTSTAFFIKENFWLSELSNKIIFTNEEFTPKVFEKLSLFFYLLSTSIYGYFVIEFLNGRFSLFIHFIPYIILFYLILAISTYFMWKVGLERYEAYG